MTAKEKQKIKNNFRQTKKWKDFRKKVREDQKIDPVTGSKLTPRFNVHHLDLSFENYQDLTMAKFVGLNSQTHDVCHFFYNTKDWRKALKETENILIKMDELNNKGE